jgi:hypothetical protein
MRLRFSLRAMFVATTLVAALCCWFLLPTFTAKRFLNAVANEDYQSADDLFRNSGDRFFAEWSDKRWGFRSTAEMRPITLAQFFQNRRDLVVEISYFEFDQNFSMEMHMDATPFGLKKPVTSETRRLGHIYEEHSERALRKR